MHALGLQRMQGDSNPGGWTNKEYSEQNSQFQFDEINDDDDDDDEDDDDDDAEEEASGRATFEANFSDMPQFTSDFADFSIDAAAGSVPPSSSGVGGGGGEADGESVSESGNGSNSVSGSVSVSVSGTGEDTNRQEAFDDFAPSGVDELLNGLS